jgi:hypothetical protein
MSSVKIFSGINYTNKMLELEPGIMDLPKEWVGKVVSLRVPKNMRVRLYDERKPSNSKEITTDVPDLSVLRWANRAVKINIEDLSKLNIVEKFYNCMNNDKKKSYFLILLIGILIGLLLARLINDKNNL